MNEDHFRKEMARVSRTFGPQGFSDERIKLIWRDAKDLFDFEFTRICNSLIASCRYSPLPKDFQGEIAKVREKNRELQKARESAEARDFFSGRLLDDKETKFRVNIIKQRMAGSISDDEWEDFKNLTKKEDDKLPF